MPDRVDTVRWWLVGKFLLLIDIVAPSRPVRLFGRYGGLSSGGDEGALARAALRSGWEGRSGAKGRAGNRRDLCFSGATKTSMPPLSG
jgi:hypothetical protein